MCYILDCVFGLIVCIIVFIKFQAQAEARAQKLKADLERKRKEAYERGAMRYQQEVGHALIGLERHMR